VISTEWLSAETDATVLLNPDGSYADASGTALEFLGVTIEELRAAGRDAFAIDPLTEDASVALQAAWNETRAEHAVGHATVKRPDGATVRVRYLLKSRPDGRYLVAFQPVPETADRPTTLYTMGRVLSAWRAAERRLETIEPGSAEWQHAQAEVDAFRDEYRRRFDERMRQSDSR
jgi:PAS domain-containing protein